VFRKQLSFLKQKGYAFISMSDLIDSIKSKKKLERSVVLTFDDGFRNVVENAYPIMKEFGAKGCFYLVSDLTGTNQLLWTDYVETVIENQKVGNFQFIFKGEINNYKLKDKKSYENAMADIKAKLRTIPDKERYAHLEQFRNIRLTDVPNEFAMASWEQINKLDPDVFEIGSHTKRHPNCANLTSNEELVDEIHNSKIDIEKNTGRKVKHFCYPAGSFNEKVVDAVKKFGYESAVTIQHGFTDENSDSVKLQRIDARKSILSFKASVSGSYSMLRRLKAILAARLN
jgi:peptidoglycan/xylan/chitin deacetylase (PgdA/CDA1 family)